MPKKMGQTEKKNWGKIWLPNSPNFPTFIIQTPLDFAIKSKCIVFCDKKGNVVQMSNKLEFMVFWLIEVYAKECVKFIGLCDKNTKYIEFSDRK